MAERERRCVASGEVLPQERLIRCVLDGAGVLVADLSADLPGRGAWVEARRASLEKALKKQAFARAFERPVVVPDGFIEHLEARLAKRCLDHVGLARRANATVIGAVKLDEALRGNKIAVRIEASDSAADGREKLDRAMRTANRAPVLIGCFSSSELGLALGRDHVIHAGLVHGRFAARWASECSRLGGFRALVPDHWRPFLSLSDDVSGDGA